MRSKNKVVSYGFVGRWANGDIGWCLPNHAGGLGRQQTDGVGDRFNKNAVESERAVLCKITVEVIHDKRGREIKRGPKL